MKRFFPLATLSIMLAAFNAPAKDITESIAQQVKMIESELPKLQFRERLLEDDAPEGTTVDVYMKDGKYRKIAVEELGETGYMLSAFYFKDGELIHAQVRWLGYKSYPNVSTMGPEHQPFTIDRTDKLLSDDGYDFIDDGLMRWVSSGKAITSSDSDYHDQQLKILAKVKAYKTFMDVGTKADDNVPWYCDRFTDVVEGFSACTSFKKVRL